MNEQGNGYLVYSELIRFLLVLLTFSGWPHIKNLIAINNKILLSLDTFFDICLSLFTVVDPSKGKKFKACEQFLSQIDSTGAYTACLEGKEADPAKQRRLVVKPHT